MWTLGQIEARFPFPVKLHARWVAFPSGGARCLGVWRLHFCDTSSHCDACPGWSPSGDTRPRGPSVLASGVSWTASTRRSLPSCGSRVFLFIHQLSRRRAAPRGALKVVRAVSSRPVVLTVTANLQLSPLTRKGPSLAGGSSSGGVPSRLAGPVIFDNKVLSRDREMGNSQTP